MFVGYCGVGSRTRGVLLTAAAVAVLCLPGPASAARNSGPFGPFAGEWRGAGHVQTSDGNSEPITCRARFDVSDSGTKLSQSLVCASDNYRFDVQCNAAADGDNVTGNWQETTRGVGGPLHGQVGAGDFEGAVEGPGFTAALSLRSNGKRQMVVIRPQGQSISEVTVSLSHK